MCWFVSTNNPATPWTCHPTEAEAVRAAMRLAPTLAVAWFCSGLVEHDSEEVA